MSEIVRKTVTVGEGGRIVVVAPEFAPGVVAEVSIQVPTSDEKLPPLRSMIGAGKGCYSTAEDAVGYIRAQRDECDD